MGAESLPSPHSRGVSSHCAICQCEIAPEEPRTVCPDCRAPYHPDCWKENGGCGVYGCSQVPETRARDDIEIPASFWGQERKPCPKCGADILAAAVRCRSCGVTFESARPESRGEFGRRRQIEHRLPKARKGAVWLFIFCLIPFTAPVAALFGVFWYSSHRKELAALPSVYLGLSRIALGVGIGQTVLTVVMGILYTLFRTT